MSRMWFTNLLTKVIPQEDESVFFWKLKKLFCPFFESTEMLDLDCLKLNSNYVWAEKRVVSKVSAQSRLPALSSANSGNCKFLLSFLQPTHLCPPPASTTFHIPSDTIWLRSYSLLKISPHSPGAGTKLSNWTVLPICSDYCKQQIQTSRLFSNIPKEDFFLSKLSICTPTFQVSKSVIYAQPPPPH